MRKLNTFQETAETGRIVIDMGDGTVLDTDNLAGGTGPTVSEIAPGMTRLTY
ncbi:hypothetical protein [Kocuria rosea]|uniref:hypothetical protein n=1 Tax=Kocuria rosea TaxID=1275 RepID=UPI0013049E5E|nr:hypothetical protein [Kocuria rosea]